MRMPKLRFKGFTDDWEQRKLGAVSEYNNGLGHEEYVQSNGKYELITLKSINSEGRLVSSGKYVNKEFETLKKDTLIMMLSEQAKGMLGMTTVIPCNNKYVLNQRVASLVPKDNINPYFLTRAINIRQMYFEQMGAGTKVQNISKGHVENCELLIPSTDEQSKIGHYFETIDNLIALYQRKCDELQKVKKCMLQKMFPKKGEKVPEIRFAGFTDDWEQRKFGEFAQRQSETRMSDNEVPCVEYEDVIAEQGVLNKNIRAKENNKTGIVFSEDDVLYGKLRPYLHNWLNPDFKGVAVGDWWVLKPQDMDKNFLYRLLQTPQFDDAANQSTGTKMPRADWKLISNLEFRVPGSIEEQVKLGKHFNNLDNLITLHQRRYDTLKEIKKYMLQNMFPKK